MLAVGSGSQVQIQKQISSMGTNLIMVMPPRGPREARRLEMADVEKLRDEASYLSAITGDVLDRYRLSPASASDLSSALAIVSTGRMALTNARYDFLSYLSGLRGLVGLEEEAGIVELVK
jgi:hypothetical protein